MSQVYLDHHSTTPLDPKVWEAMVPYFTTHFGNASGRIHSWNWVAQSAVEKARRQVADAVGCNLSEVVFTSGATEANAIGLEHTLNALIQPGREKVLYFELEHSSVTQVLKNFHECSDLEAIPVLSTPSGEIDFEDLSKKLSAQVALVVVAYAHHEVGAIQDIQRIVQMCEIHGAKVFTDAVQAFGKVPFSFRDLGVVGMTVSAHKVHGPKGAGAWIRNEKLARMTPKNQSHQESGFRSGTLNVPAIVGMGEAFEIQIEMQAKEIQKMSELRDELEKKLFTEIPDLKKISVARNVLPHHLNVALPEIDGSAFFSQLRGLAVSNASSCVSGIYEYSPNLLKLGHTVEVAKSSLRLGLGRFTTREEIEIAVEKIVTTYRPIREQQEKFNQLWSKI